ncbi:hypothetical protein BVC80_8733g16 [Macleaya cordata]|uniref:Epidermal patterning factor-like protein n=1 Tax=Macleaya cordata TaxID=56857 RepID=A0A200QBV8_MACCD|nr:hypothetical protein BVC80_8733g16 [Macleaya cordata]
MRLLNPDLLYSTTILVTVLHLLFFPASCIDQQPISAPPQGVLMEGKSRLGSTPPSCNNRCNQCNPCMAIQVPTQTRDRVKPGFDRLVPLMNKEEKTESLPTTTTTTGKDQYTNYKPLGWKCRCGNLLFNP